MHENKSVGMAKTKKTINIFDETKNKLIVKNTQTQTHKLYCNKIIMKFIIIDSFVFK